MTAPPDPDLRCETPLATRLKARIAAAGPLTIDAYMAVCLHDPEYGYYRTRPVLGRGGDFITAPEISQVFGEVLGAWCVVVWEQMGRPSPIRLVELGPGRGTLMADVLRVARRVPAFAAACDVHLVECSPRLLDEQRLTLRGHAVTWHDEAAAVPPGAAILIGNEFLDALPVRQVADATGDERVVVVDATGQLRFAWRAREGSALRDQPQSIIETQTLDALAPLLDRPGPLAAVLLDYGDVRAGAAGDTLQAVRAHRFEHPLTSPGEADLSVQVDFAAVADWARAGGLAVDGPVAQAEFLGALGVVERASRLIASNPAQANMIETSVARLLAPHGMGGRFKAIGLRTLSIPPLPGLQLGGFRSYGTGNAP